MAWRSTPRWRPSPWGCWPRTPNGASGGGGGSWPPSAHPLHGGQPHGRLHRGSLQADLSSTAPLGQHLPNPPSTKPVCWCRHHKETRHLASLIPLTTLQHSEKQWWHPARNYITQTPLLLTPLGPEPGRRDGINALPLILRRRRRCVGGDRSRVVCRITSKTSSYTWQSATRTSNAKCPFSPLTCWTSDMIGRVRLYVNS